MPFIGAAIVGAVGLAGTTAGAIVGGLINVGIAGGLAYASSALGGQQGATAQAGIQTDVEMGGGQPRGCTYGRVGVAGYLAYINTFADNNNMLDMVYLLGDGPHDAIERVWIGGKAYAVTVLQDNAYRTAYRVEGVLGGAGVSYLTLTLWRGFEDQPASTQLVNYANPAGRWTTADRLSGICYVHMRGLYDEEAFPNGIPQMVFEMRGRRLYDWRRDSTVGGSGAHRWDDPTTWEFSENPIVQLYNYQRGTWLGGELTVGMGVAPVDLAADSWTAAANACDELVAESDGSSVPRYRCGTYVAADEEHATVIQRFLDACAGALYERVGAFSPQAGVAQIVTYPTITDGDLVSGRQVRFAARRSRSDLTNGVFGSFSDPADQYELVAYEARTSAAAEAADGEIRRVQVDYPSVHHALQAQRLGQIHLGLSRLQATATITLGFAAVVLEPGDWLRWDSARYGLRIWLVVDTTSHADQTVTLNLREISAAAYAWSEDDEGAVSVPGVPGDKPDLITTVPLMSVLATSLVSEAGAKQPALRVTWSPILDATVDAIVIEYRPQGSADVMTATSTAPNGGELLISAGLQGATTYEVRGTLATTPRRTTTWTDWQVVTTGDMTVAPAPGTVTVEAMEAALRERVLTRQDEDIAALREITDALGMAVANVDAVARKQADEVWTASRRETERMGVRVGEAEASITAEREVRANADSALATDIGVVRANVASNTASITSTTEALTDLTNAVALQRTDLEAQIEGVVANVSVQAIASASKPDGALAAYQIAVKAGDGEDLAQGGLMLAVYGTPGNYSSKLFLQADSTSIMDGAGGKALLTVDASGTAYLNADLVADGSLTAAKVIAATLSAITSNTGDLNVTGLMSIGAKISASGPNGNIIISD
ncbi:phage tail tip fiber protein [Xanthobacter sp. TB0139]|uniref:phage tail tip fiber protein n=1 Tax=Xanthobacter sp. TB0139 TaxID=3459178 RepID=UPI00403958C8